MIGRDDVRLPILALPLIVAIAGCAAPQAGSEAIVLTGNVDVVRGCRFIEQASGDQNLIGGALAGAAREDAIRRLRNRAVDVGGTHIVTQNISTGWAGANAVGDIYKC
jgi:uncharacterized protein YbjQ (UPF0145 family)